MKLFYFIFGIITTILIAMILFAWKFHVYLDDYYIELLFTKYHDIWKYTYLSVALLFYISCNIFIWYEK